MDRWSLDKGGIMKKVTTFAFIMVMLLIMIPSLLVPSYAFAYSTTGYKMNAAIWYRPYHVLMGETRENIRLSMATWNELIPEWRRVCFDNTDHYLTNYPSRNRNSSIYKVSAGNNYVAQNSWWHHSGTPYTYESDINLNADMGWCNGRLPGCYDVRSVMLHEVGHTLGLGHSEQKSAVMYKYSYQNTLKRNLTQDDKNGLNDIYK